MMMANAGVEPTTLGLLDPRSNQLIASFEELIGQISWFCPQLRIAVGAGGHWCIVRSILMYPIR